jgi:hypothetical protein
MDTFKLSYKGLDIWNRVERTDPAYTKPFDRGSFKGTAVDAVYNIRRLTEVLGPVGQNWGWTVLSERLDTFGEGQHQQTIHSMVLRAWFRREDGSMGEVDQVGHTKVAYWTRGPQARLIIDEEFGKKSLTDALSKIMLSLGASADIWMGAFDGNRYVAPKPEPEPANDGLVAEAQGHLLAVTNADEPELRRIRDWLAGSADGRGASRWVKLGVQAAGLREQLATAMNERALELGISLKGAA